MVTLLFTPIITWRYYPSRDTCRLRYITPNRGSTFNSILWFPEIAGGQNHKAEGVVDDVVSLIVLVQTFIGTDLGIEV